VVRSRHPLENPTFPFEAAFDIAAVREHRPPLTRLEWWMLSAVGGGQAEHGLTPAPRNDPTPASRQPCRTGPRACCRRWR
jgi:hypothetical protein